MGRPHKQTVDYFPHYCIHKKTIFIIEEQYGDKGYAFWFKLLELLGTTEGHFLDLNDGVTWEFLRAKTRTSDECCGEILELLAKLQAIDGELWKRRVVWCQNFVDGIAHVYVNRRVDIPQRPSFQEEKGEPAVVSTEENPQSRVEESRGEERRVKRSCRLRLRQRLRRMTRSSPSTTLFAVPCPGCRSSRRGVRRLCAHAGEGSRSWGAMNSSFARRSRAIF